MCTVYIDVLIVVNFFIDYILLLCERRVLNLRGSPARMMIAAAAGGAFSLAALLPDIAAPLNILLDIASAALLTLIAFGKTDLRGFAVRTFTFFSVSFSFCGAMMFVCTVFRPKGVEVINDVVYFNISPVLLIILTLGCYYLLRIFRSFTGGSAGRHVCSVSIFFEGAEAAFSALVDTGCHVREPFSGEFVIIADKSCLPQGVSPGATRLIPYESLGGEGVLEGFRAQRIVIDGAEVSEKLYIGVCEGVLKGDIRAIVPYDIYKNVR